MSVKVFLIAMVVTLVVFVAIDFIWLTAMADRLYRPALGDMLASQFRPLPAASFYLIYAAGLTFLAVRPGLMAGRPMASFVHGAVLGLVAYATYDLTNQATLKNWSTLLTLADLAWGTFLSATAAWVGHWAGHIVTRRLAG